MELKNLCLDIPKRTCQRPILFKHIALIWCYAVLIFCAICLWTPYSRNTLLNNVIPRPWRDKGTFDIIYINYLAEWTSESDAKHVTDKSCASTVNLSSISYVKRDSMVALLDSSQDFAVTRIEALSKRHGRFLPIMNRDNKMQILNLYLILAHAFNMGNVSFFFVDGSLLGHYRHGGLIPWDDDIDIGIHLSDRQKVNDALLCIEGYAVNRNVRPGHWKFHRANHSFPYIDLFFYQQYSGHVFAVTDYLRHTFWYSEKDTFPLTFGYFDGIKVPVPKDAPTIMEKVFDVSVCRAAKPHRGVNLSWVPEGYKDGFSLQSVPCRDLRYLYKMKLYS